MRSTKWVMAAVLAVTLCAQTWARAQDSKPRITVYGFESKASSGIWHDAKWDIGTGLAEMLIDALQNTGKFIVLERLNLEDVTFEQDLVTAGRVAEKTGAATGRIIGAQYIVRGTLTEFTVAESGGLGGFRWKWAKVGVGRKVAHVAGTLRVYDAVTSQLYASHRFEKKVPATALSFSGNYKHVGLDLGGFKKTPLGKATNEAIKDMVDFLIKDIPTVSAGELEAKEKKIEELEAELEKLKEEKKEK